MNVRKARPEGGSANLSLWNNDAGDGAITPYHNGSTMVKADIQREETCSRLYENFRIHEELVTVLGKSRELHENVPQGFWMLAIEQLLRESRVTNALPSWKSHFDFSIARGLDWSIDWRRGYPH
jgi:hypothetical protein